jgi:hypothetical protein
LLALVAVNLPPVQTYLARKAAAALSERLKTRVSVGRVSINLLNHIDLQNIYLEDRAHDTVLYAGEIEVRASDWFLFTSKRVIKYVGLTDVNAHIYRTATSAKWNYEFIADAFGSGARSSGNSQPIEFDLKRVAINNVRVHYDDQWVGEDIDIDIGKADIDGKGIDVKKKLIDIETIGVKKAGVTVKEYKGGRPANMRRHKANAVDTTPFNDGMWAVNVGRVNLDASTFTLKMDDMTPAANLFDEDHLFINKIKADVSGITIRGDTIRGQVNDLYAVDRCGLAIKKMKSKVTVSPNASICDDLYLETNNSKIRGYYAMLYKRFPDFNSYIDSVVMVGRLKDAEVDKRDIAFFAPQLNILPEIAVRVTGNAKGTVADLSGHDIMVSDGNTVVKGDISMKGLPDIYKTYISYTKGEILTNGKGILRYAPQLTNSDLISLKSISYAYFKGDYEGYIENFAVKGGLNSNLGGIGVNVKMSMPGFRSDRAGYKGSVSTNGFMVGTLFNQPLLGSLTMKEDIAGTSFDPDRMQCDINGTISEFGINGYDYHSILTQGTVAKKEFKGSLIVDDPNLALEFDGGINYVNKDIDVKATAHLLFSNFREMKLTNDTVTASADFDLNCTGSNIDNFSGYAKLNNIDLQRNSHKVALDSIWLNSSTSETGKLLTIRSNDVSATISGNYQLSKLPPSVQYYLSRYLPNYIKQPANTAPDQDLTFKVVTGNIDSILAVTIPLIRGFDHSTFSGSLNTNEQKLSLNVNVPYGSIGKFHMSNIAVSGEGNLNTIALNTMVDNVSVGDSMLNGSLSVTTTVGNDSVAFTVATTSPDASSSLTLNGQIIARKDSLFLTLFPSQFFIGQAKWDIGGGSRVVYSDKFLQVQGLELSSALQRITVNTEARNDDRPIVINTENLDLGQLGSWAGLASYQPDGRVNGSVAIGRLFDGVYVSANMKGTEVMLGADTLGTIDLIGSYDGAKKLLSLDPQTGIYRGDVSLVASGDMSFDSTNNEKLDGSIQFSNTPVVWASPFLTGIFSHLSGMLNGNIVFSGSSYQPKMDGTVVLQNAGLKVDYTGCSYTIPSANIQLDNKRITFGNVQVMDGFKNTATLTGHFSHNMFRNMRMHLIGHTRKFEVLNTTAVDNSLFYGNVVANIDSVVVKGPFNNISMNVYGARPAARSHIYIPESSAGDLNSYSYVSFKNYGKSQDTKAHLRPKDKFNISIDADFNDLAEMTIILDPTTGDQIIARGEGNIRMEIPSDNDIRIYGLYTINDGLYTFTFKRLFVRQFNLNSGSKITFTGPFSDTRVNVDAVYRAKAKLYNLLTEQDKTLISGSELIDAETAQWVDVVLHMKDLLKTPTLTFDLDLEDKHSQSTLAYRKLTLMNYDESQKFNEVASLLLINDFIPQDGIGGSTVATGAINNVSQIFSSSASTALTSVINKLTGDKQVNLNVNYTNYNYSDQTIGGVNRSQIKISGSKNYFNDRLSVEVGSTSDWGRPTSTSNTSNFNLTGDFRIQYLLSQESGVRLNCFRTSDYDVTLDRDIIRSGVGVSWRKSFDSFGDFFRGNKYADRQRKLQEDSGNKTDVDTSGKQSGTE